MVSQIFLMLAALLIQTQAQYFGPTEVNIPYANTITNIPKQYQTQIISNPIPTSCACNNQPSTVINNPGPILPNYPPQIIANGTPNTVVTTVIDNSVSNSLANALQLLIVSNLIESKINPIGIETEIVAPTPYICESTPNYYNQIEYAPIEYVSNVDVMGPYNQYVDVPNYYNGYTEIISPVGPTGPYAAEVLFPSAIPAQLTCNFGYVPTTKPVVSVNVEPLGAFEPIAYGNPAIYY